MKQSAMHPVITLLCSLIFFLAGSANASVLGDIKGHKGARHDANQFAKAFREGASSANEVALPLANGNKLKTLAGYEPTSASGAVSAWKFQIYGWRDGTAYDDKVEVLAAPGMMVNYGNRYEYVFLLPAIDTRFVDKVEEKLKKSKKNLEKSAKGIVVTFPRNDSGQLMVNAKYEYDDKTSTGRLKEHVEQLLLNSRGLLNEYLEVSPKVEKDHLDELRKSSPANLEKADFYRLLEDLSPFDIARWDMPDAGVEHGYAEFSFKNTNIRIWNERNRFALGFVAYPDAALSAEQVKTLSDQWQEWGMKKLGKRTSSVEVRKDRQPDTGIVLTLVYPLDGSLKGKDIEKLFVEGMREGREEAIEAFNKLHRKIKP